MKKLLTSILMLLLVFTLPTVSIGANKAHYEPIAMVPIEFNESSILLLRLDEIKAMDKSDMTASEKKALRKEVKSIREKLGGGGVYISIGAAIIIILLLIILL